MIMAFIQLFFFVFISLISPSARSQYPFPRCMDVKLILISEETAAFAVQKGAPLRFFPDSQCQVVLMESTQ